MTCNRKFYINKVLVPCGKCIACKKNKSHEWAKRISDEIFCSDGQCSFITLTYKENNKAQIYSLSIDDIQKFWKRLRKKFPNKKFKYFCCGEYGEQNQRPHYHAIIIGLSLKDLEAEKKQHSNYATSKVLEKTWPFGFNTVGIATINSIHYVSGYILKTTWGQHAVKIYDKIGLTRPFLITSKQLGLKYLKENQEMIRNTRKGNPRYYIKKSKEIDSNINIIKGSPKIISKEEGKKLKTIMTKNKCNLMEARRRILESNLAREQNELAKQHLLSRRHKNIGEFI
ncbi:replication initiation protein [Tortoise microvirus 30]|nr:replication initiation protein [Tortoise microvirus 30]